MAISYTNIWYDNILKRVRLFLRNEFGNAVSVYIGEYKSAGNESLRLLPLDSNVIENSKNHQLKEYSVGVYYYHSLKNIQQVAFTEHILSRVSRIEAIFQQNPHKSSDSDGNYYFEGVLQGVTLNARIIDEPAEFSGYIARWEFTCKHLGNIS